MVRSGLWWLFLKQTDGRQRWIGLKEAAGVKQRIDNSERERNSMPWIKWTERGGKRFGILST